MVYGRLSRRLRTLGMRSFQQYLDHLEQEDGDEWQAFTNAPTTNLTSFFREPHHFDKLREELQQRSSRTRCCCGRARRPPAKSPTRWRSPPARPSAP